MSAYINVEQRNAVFAELKGELYSRFRKEKISVEWCLKTEKLLTYAVSKVRTQKDIDELRSIIVNDITEEEKQAVQDKIPALLNGKMFREAVGDAFTDLARPLCREGGYGDLLLLGSVTLCSTLSGILVLLSKMIG